MIEKHNRKKKKEIKKVETEDLALDYRSPLTGYLSYPEEKT